MTVLYAYLSDLSYTGIASTCACMHVLVGCSAHRGEHAVVLRCRDDSQNRKGKIEICTYVQYIIAVYMQLRV